MIIKCNKCWSEYETEFDVPNSTVYNCEVCANIQILDNGVWRNIAKEDLDRKEVLRRNEGLKCENCKRGKFEYDETVEMLICDCCESEIK